MQHIRMGLAILILLLGPGQGVWGNEQNEPSSSAGQPEAGEFDFPEPSKPLLDDDFFKTHARIIVPVSGGGLAVGVTLIILGIANFSIEAESGYGSSEMNRSVILLSSGMFTAVLSGIFFKTALPHW